jgi:hypothetical protein
MPMRKLLIVALLLLRPPQVPLEPPSQASMVERAVEMVKTCPHSKIDRTEISKDGTIKGEADKKESAEAEKMTISVLLRPGRFVWKAGMDIAPVLGGWGVKFHFLPSPKKQPEARPGEDERYNQVMNNLAGDVIIDQNGQIVRVEAYLTKPQLFAMWSVRIATAKVIFNQKKVGVDWYPDSVNVDIGAQFLGFPVHRTYFTAFNCGK